MATDEFDTETYVLYPVFAVGAASTLGLLSTDILPFIDLADTFVTAGGIDFTWGRALSAIALIAVLVNRQGSIQDTSGIDLWVAYATLGLVIAPPFFPALESTLAQQPAAWVSFVVQSVGFAIVTYVN